MGLLDYVLFGNTVLQYLFFVGALLIGIIGGKIAYYAISHIVKAFTKRTKTDLDDLLIEALQKPAIFAIFYVAFNYAYHIVTLDARATEVFGRISFVLLVITVTWAVVNVADMFIKRYFTRFASKAKTDLDERLLPVIKGLINAVIIIIAIIAILDNLGFDIASLLAGLGIGGLAFALAAQDSLKNFFGGVTVFLDKPFKIGDVVKIDNEREGFVREVGIRSTKIETYGGTYIVVPNAKIADSMVENISKEKMKRIRMVLGLDMNTPHRKVEDAANIIKETIKKNKRTDHSNMIVNFDSYGEYSLNIQVIYWIKDIPNVPDIKHEVNMEIKKQLDNANIRLAYPTRNIYMRK